MPERRVPDGGDAPQQVRECRVAAEGHAQQQRALQVPDRATGPVLGIAGPDGQERLAGAGPAPRQGREGGLEGHLGLHAGERLHHARVEGEGHDAAVRGRGAERRRRRRPGQALRPPGQVARQGAAARLLPLPERQRPRLAFRPLGRRLAVGFQPGGHLAGQHGRGPLVGDHGMQRDHEHAAASRRPKDPAGPAAALQLERAHQLGAHRALERVLVRQPPPVRPDPGRRVDPLHDPAVDGADRGPERVVPGRGRRQRRVDRGGLRRASQPPDGDEVGRDVDAPAHSEKDGLLRVRQRVRRWPGDE